MRKIPTAAAALAAGAVLVLSGCSDAGSTATPPNSEPSSSAQASATFNDADVAFAQGMVPHHEQAIEMSDLLMAKDGVDPDVLALAERIKAAQGPELEQLNGWLEAWGADTGDMGGMDHGDMGGDDMGGMMSEEDMAALEAAPGPEASTLFLEQMIEHHQGAVEMAATETEQGQSPDAIALAEKITADQTAEIEEMQALLDAV